MNIIKVDLELWKRRHPRASKLHPNFYVDFNPEGSMERSIYSWTGSRNIVLDRDNSACRICGKTGEWIDVEKFIYESVEVQHIIPRKNGGTNHPANLITLCRKHHLMTFKRDYGGVPTIPKKNQMQLDIEV